MKTYIKATIFLIIYVIFTRLLFIAMIVFPNTFAALTIETASASFFGLAFLYFFDHKKLFKFAQVIEKKKKNSTEKLINKFLRFGKFIASIMVGYVGGPLFCALTIHLLLPDYKYKYLLTLLVCASSSFLALALARGILHLAIRLI